MAESGEDEPTLSSDYTAWASRRSRARAARARSLDEEHRHRSIIVVLRKKSHNVPTYYTNWI